MPHNIKISKLKARRGTDTQRKLLSFDQGELIYTVDTKRFFIGDGVTPGGIVAGSKIFYPPLYNKNSLSTLNAQLGDIAMVNTSFYQLTSSNYTVIASWGKLTQLLVDPVIFNYDDNSTLTVKVSSISSIYINPNTVSNGIIINNGIIQSSFQTKSLEISANKLSLKSSGIDERELNSSTFTNGISGGSGNKVGLKVNPTNFSIDTGGLNLKLSSISEQYIPSSTFTNGISGGSGNKVGLKVNPTNFYIDNSGNLSLSGNSPFTSNIVFSDIKPEWIGAGLTYNTSASSISANITDVDYTTIIVNNNSRLAMTTLHSAISTNQLLQSTVDIYGRVIAQASSIYGGLTANNSESIFNGNPDQLIREMYSTTRTRLTAINATGGFETLSSAGFITFEGPTITRDGSIIGRFAIPIFTY